MPAGTPVSGGGGGSTGGGSSGGGGGGGTGGGGEEPGGGGGGGGPIEPGFYCWDCVPWPNCPYNYANDFCSVIREDGSQWVSSWSCAPQGYCEEEEEEEGDEWAKDPPCTPEYNRDGIDINHCDDDPGRGYDWDYGIYVSARVPPHRVQVDPFPRWIVAMGAPLPAPYESGQPGRLTLQDYPAYTPPGLCYPNGPGFSEGCWSDTVDIPPKPDSLPDDWEPDPGDMQNYRIGLRWRRLDQTPGQDLGAYPPICWDFDERAWNVGADYGYGPIPAMACGTSVTHIYETSSWDKPHNGPRFFPPEEACSGSADHCCEQVPSGPGEWDMPAYQVRVPTYWGAEWKVEWEVWEQVGTEWSDCGCSGVDPAGSPSWQGCGDPPPGICVGVHNDPPTEWWGRWGEPTYGWVHHAEGWHPMDLRDYGGATWYYTSGAVITTGEGPWCAFEYADPNPGDTVRVPVIEIQSVLTDPCMIDGTCP